VHWTFDDNSAGTGAFTPIEGEGVPWFVRGDGTAAPEYATYDASGRVALVQEVAGLADLGTTAMRSNLLSLLDGSGVGVAQGATGGPAVTWVGEAEYRRVSIDRSGATQGHSVSVAGISAGGAMLADSGLAYGFMFGLNQSDAEVDSGISSPSYDNDSTGFFLGLGIATDMSGLQLDGGLRFGNQSNETRRLVNDNLAPGGVAIATGSFDTTWFSVSGRVAYDFEMASNWTLTPTFAASYTLGNADAYTESGADASASVGSHSFDVGKYEIGLTASRDLDMGTLSGSLSYIATRASGGDTFNVDMIGDTNAVSVGAIDSDAAQIGLNYNTELGNGMVFELRGDVLVGGSGVSGGGLSLSFLSRF
jgi:hypothetical protein